MSSSTVSESIPTSEQRLAESFETALRIAEGRALTVNMDTGEEQVFSNQFACPICGYSLHELEPRLFSFNNPMGACPECDGLGHVEFFDPKRVVLFPGLSLAAGAVKGWDRRNPFDFQMLQNLADHLPFRCQYALRRIAGKHPAHCPLRFREGKNTVHLPEQPRPSVGQGTFVRRYPEQSGTPLP